MCSDNTVCKTFDTFTVCRLTESVGKIVFDDVNSMAVRFTVAAMSPERFTVQ